MKKFWDLGLFAALMIAWVPFSLGVLLLEVYGPSDELRTGLGSYLPSPDNGKITYVAVSNLHYVICAIIFTRCWMLVRDESTATGVTNVGLCRSVGTTVVSIVAVFSVFFVLSSYFDLTYIRLTRTPSSVFPRCESHVASMLPVFFAVVAAASLVAYTSLQVRLFVDSQEGDRDIRYLASYRSIIGCLPMYSCILVTAVISSAVWFHLPANLLGDIPGDRAALRSYGYEMTLFLGVTYTLTTLVAVAWPVWRLSRRAHEVGYAPEWASVWQWPDQGILLPAKQMVAVLAPLITSLLVSCRKNPSKSLFSPTFMGFPVPCGM